MKPSPLFVDTGAWVALFNERDRDHARAAVYWDRVRSERRPILTTDDVLDETYTLIRRTRAGLEGAVEFHRLVRARAGITPSTEGVRAQSSQGARLRHSGAYAAGSATPRGLMELRSNAGVIPTRALKVRAG